MLNSTWKDNVEPTPGDIAKLNTIESVINCLFESPTYGTRQQITNPEIIKAMISLIRNYKIQDSSHYNGNEEAWKKERFLARNYKKMSLYFKGEQLFTSYNPLDCKLDDPEFRGMRINVCYNCNEITILFDFYHEIEKYGKKCVIFAVIFKSPIVDRGKKEEKEKTSLAVQYIGKTQKKTQKKKSLHQASLF